MLFSWLEALTMLKVITSVSDNFHAGYQHIVVKKARYI